MQLIASSLLAIFLAGSGILAKRLQDLPKRSESPQKESTTISGLCYEQIDFCTSYVQKFETAFRSAPPEYHNELARNATAIENGCKTCVRQLNLQGECRFEANKACGLPTRLLRGEP